MLYLIIWLLGAAVFVVPFARVAVRFVDDFNDPDTEEAIFGGIMGILAALAWPLALTIYIVARLAAPTAFKKENQ